MVFRNLIFQPEVVEQRLRPVVLSHHDQQASDDQNQTEHGQMLSSNMLLLNLILLIDVTFSTPTGDDTHNPGRECNRNCFDSWTHELRLEVFIAVRREGLPYPRCRYSRPRYSGPRHSRPL